MKVNSNIQAQIANSVLKANEEKYAKSTERMSSGYKINHAQDSPAGMAISNKMHAQIRSLEKATDNSSNAINVVQTAEGALSEVQNMVQRISELSVKASNGTITDADRGAIQAEIKQLKSEIERIAEDTEYNTQNLLGGEQALKGYTDTASVDVIDYDADFHMGEYEVDFSSSPVKILQDGTDVSGNYDIVTEGNITTITDKKGAALTVECDPSFTGSANLDIKGIGGMKIQVGSAEGQEIQIVIPKISLKNMGIENLDVSTEEGAHKALDMVGGALDYISKVRSNLGAYQNRLESTVASLNISVENLTQSYSTIKDIDMATEMVEYTKLQVLVQAGTSMLTQANEQPQQALQLLQ